MHVFTGIQKNFQKCFKTITATNLKPTGNRSFLAKCDFPNDPIRSREFKYIKCHRRNSKSY